jgi:hypothetical protein
MRNYLAGAQQLCSVGADQEISLSTKSEFSRRTLRAYSATKGSPMGESVMRDQQQVHRRTGRYIAIRPHDARQKCLMIGACLIAGAIIVLWPAYLPNLPGSILGLSNVVPQHLMENSVNRLHKGDRMSLSVGASFEARWSGIAAVRKPASVPKQSKLVAVGARETI